MCGRILSLVLEAIFNSVQEDLYHFGSRGAGGIENKFLNCLTKTPTLCFYCPEPTY